MTLHKLLTLLSLEGTPATGHAYSGTLNIETGFVEVSSDYFGACSNCAPQKSTVRVCESCGRSAGNNVSFLAGRGDGVYSGITFAVGEQVIATIFVFDEQIEFASACGVELERLRQNETLRGNEFLGLFLQACKEFSHLAPFLAGTVTAKFQKTDDLGFLIADQSHASDTRFATVDVPFADGDFDVILFSEPLAESSIVQTSIALGSSIEDFTRGVSDAMRPRVAAVIRQDFVKRLVPEICEIDWGVQAHVWSETQIASNLAGNNSAHANYNNGIFWGLACRDAQSIDSDLWYMYSTRSLGFFIQGAFSGHEECEGYMVDQIESGRDQGILDFEVLSSAVNPRGLLVDDGFVESINQICATFQEPRVLLGAISCGDCGNEITRESAKFCTNCGSAL